MFCLPTYKSSWIVFKRTPAITFYWYDANYHALCSQMLAGCVPAEYMCVHTYQNNMYIWKCVHRALMTMHFSSCLFGMRYKIAKMHRIPYFDRSLSAKEPRNYWLFCGTRIKKIWWPCTLSCSFDMSYRITKMYRMPYFPLFPQKDKKSPVKSGSFGEWDLQRSNDHASFLLLIRHGTHGGKDA